MKPNGLVLRFLALWFLCLLGVAGVWYGTLNYGVGLSTDSCVYVGAARSLMRGEGLRNGPAPGIRVGEPLTHYPPGYPALLAAVGVWGGPVRAARAVNMVALPLEAFIIFAIVRRIGRNAWVGVLAAMVWLCEPAVMEVHLYALSEPPFLVVLLASFLWVGTGGVSHGRRLACVAGMAATAFLMRYIGIARGISAAIEESLQTDGKIGFRFRCVGRAFAVMLLAPAAWFGASALVMGNATDRELGLHVPGFWHLRVCCATIGGWLFPHSWGSAPSVSGCRVVGVVLIVVLLARSLRPAACRGREATALLGFLSFIGVYLAVVLAVMCFVDAMLSFDSRIALPVFAAGVLALSCMLSKTGACGRLPRGRRVCMAIAVFCYVIGGAQETLRMVVYANREGLGFSGRGWREKAVMKWLQEQPEGLSIISNVPDGIYAVTQRLSREVPACHEPFSKRAYSIEEQRAALEDFKQAIMRGAVLLYFRGYEWRFHQVSLATLLQQGSLSTLVDTGDCVVFGRKEMVPVVAVVDNPVPSCARR